MTATCLLAYAAVLTFAVPTVLTRVTGRGISPRLSVGVWLSAIGLAVAAWLGAGAGMAAELFEAHGSAAAARLCVDLLLAVHHLGWGGDVILAVLVATGVAASAVVARRLQRTLREFWLRSNEHASAARILGSPNRHPGVVVMPAARAAAYCVAGQPDAIVVTTAAVDALPPAQLDAVVAHERAHLAQRHPQLLMVLRALAAALPRLPLFRAAPAAVEPLLELWADDVAVRRCGREVLLDGLVALAGQPRAPGGALGVGDVAVARRAARLARPDGAAALLRQRVSLTATLVLFVCLPGVLAWLCYW